MANRNHAHKAKANPEGEEVIELTDEELDKLIIQEPEKEPSEEVKEAIAEVREELHKKKVTLGVPDSIFHEPLSGSEIIPESMHAVSGNEDGNFEGEMGNSAIYAVTEKGLKNTNDDGFLVDPESKTVVVTDGLGGYEGGFAASSIAHFAAAKNMKEPLEEIPAIMHVDIRKYQKNNPKYKDMSTTMVAARQKSPDKVEFVHVGDSRAIVIRKGKIAFQTRDDNYLEYLMERENIKNEDEARTEYGANYYKYRNLVSQACGVGYIDTETFKEDKERIEPHNEEFETKEGDIILLCSDGLTDNLPNDEIAKIIEKQMLKGKKLSEALETVKEKALKNMRTWEGKPDNIAIAGYIVQ